MGRSLVETAVARYAEREIVGLQPSDHDLVAAVRRGEDRAFEQLFERYQRRIAAYVYGMVNDHGRAEDITQEIFISALRRMRETERPIAFKPWIYEIAKNACIDQFRRSRRTEEISYDAEEGLGAADYGRLAQRGPSPDAAMDQKQALHDLCGAFGGLSETHHQILVLRELEGLSYREIGERLGMSRPSVESTLFRARRRLSEEYDELASGQRCIRVQALIGTAAEGLLGSRDARRLARHVSHCQPCRKQARAAGVDGAILARRPGRVESLGAKIAGLLPFPAFLRPRRGDSDSVLGSAGAGHGQALIAQWSAVGGMPESVVAGWSKAAAAAATLLVAGVGAGVGSDVNARPAESKRPPAIELKSAPQTARRTPASRPTAPRATTPARSSGTRSSVAKQRTERRFAGGKRAPAGREQTAGSGAPAATGGTTPAGRSDGDTPAPATSGTPQSPAGGTPAVDRTLVPAGGTPDSSGATPPKLVPPPAVPVPQPGTGEVSAPATTTDPATLPEKIESTVGDTVTGLGG